MRGVALNLILRVLAAMALTALAACNTLPTIDSKAGSPSQAAHLEGARGPLSAKQTKAILARLASRGQETSIFDRHLALEEGIVGSPLMVGNKVVLLQNGPATYQARCASTWRAISSRTTRSARNSPTRSSRSNPRAFR
jgi:cardiolipin synthase